jgi:hypothetical protein
MCFDNQARTYTLRKFGAPEDSTVSTLIEGLQLAHADDAELLTHGMALFDVLY